MSCGSAGGIIKTHLSSICNDVFDICLRVNLVLRVCAFGGEFWVLGENEGERLGIDNMPIFRSEIRATLITIEWLYVPVELVELDP